MKNVLVLFLFVFIYATQYNEGDRNFTIVNPQNTRNIYGDYLLGGNTVECVTNKTDTFNNAQCIDSVSHNDNNRITKYIDIDNDSRTWNSSTSTIILPDDAKEIVWAGLFWQGNINNYHNYYILYNNYYYLVTNLQRRAEYNSDNINDGFHYVDITSNSNISINSTNANNVLIKLNNSKYTRVFADKVDYYKWYGNYGFVYSAYKDITNLFSQKVFTKEINITVANISANEGRENSLGNYAGWAVAIIYKSQNKDSFKRVVIYNGYRFLSGTASKSIIIDNLMLPQKNSVDSKFSAFVGEGDYVYTPDHMKIDNYIVHGDYNNDDNIFDSRMSAAILRADIGDNNKINTDGIDLDEYNVTDILTQIRDNNPSTTEINITLDTEWDAYFASMIAFSVKLYVPQFCYDYSYSQNGIYFTEPYNPNTSPRIRGNVIPNNDINVSVYIRNNDNNDIIAKNLTFNIIDINNSQLKFNPQSLALYDSEKNQYIKINDFNISSNNKETNITGILEGNITKASHKYLYFSFIPLKEDINQSMQNWEIKYLLYKNINGEEVNIPQSIKLADLPICKKHFEYNPAWNQFNVVDKNLFNGIYSKYNLFTQVVGREHPFKVVSYNKDDLNQPQNYKYAVLLEMINVGGFHDINATCQNPYAIKYPINSKYYLPINFNNTSNVNVNVTPLSAVKNSAFRIEFIDWNELFKQKNFSCNDKTEYKGMPRCISGDKENYITIFGINSPCLVDNGGACFDSTNNDTYACLKCTLKYYGNRVCSRDNFSVRPDSFYIVLKDPITNSSIADDINKTDVNLSAGIDYNFSITATTYKNLNRAIGYTGYFGNNIDKNISLNWSSDKNLSVCNDISSKIIKKYIINGYLNAKMNNSEIGEYNLSVSDKDWTKVDWEPSYLTHHNNPHFIANTADCNIYSSVVQLAGVDVIFNGNNLNISSLNGCLITNIKHFLHFLNKKTDYINITFMPYKFGVVVNDTYGIGNETNKIGWLYDTDIINYPNDENNSYKIQGQIKALNAAGAVTRNFTKGCFAKDINITINHIASNNALPMQYIIYENNNTKYSKEINATFIFNYKKENFIKANNGAGNIVVKMNYKKIFNKPYLPIEVNFTDINVSSNLSYELNGTKKVTGKKDLNKFIQFRYGKIIAPNITGYPQKVGNAYQLKGVFKYMYWTNNGWVINKEHNSSNYGEVNITKSYHPNIQMSLSSINKGEQNVTLLTTHALPYSAKIHLSIPSWLWSHPLAKNYQDPDVTNLNCLTHPCFKVNFLKESNGWGGVGINNKYKETNKTVDINASLKKINVNKSTLKKINW